MGDALFPKLIFMAVFFGVTTILLANIIPLIQAGSNVNNPSMNWGEMGVYQYQFYDPNPWEVSNGTVKAHWSQWGSPSQTFTSSASHRHDQDVWIVRNNTWYDEDRPNHPFYAYRDCIIFWMDYGIFNLDERFCAVSYEEIGLRFDPEKNYSRIPTVMNADYMLFVKTGPGYDFGTALYANQYNISIGWSLNLTDEVTASPWGITAQILTFDIPNVNPFISAMIAIPMYCTMGFTFVAIVSRFFPTVAGL